MANKQLGIKERVKKGIVSSSLALSEVAKWPDSKAKERTLRWLRIKKKSVKKKQGASSEPEKIASSAA